VRRNCCGSFRSVIFIYGIAITAALAEVPSLDTTQIVETPEDAEVWPVNK
jgi:hypothetical protein